MPPPCFCSSCLPLRFSVACLLLQQQQTTRSVIFCTPDFICNTAVSRVIISAHLMVICDSNCFVCFACAAVVSWVMLWYFFFMVDQTPFNSFVCVCVCVCVSVHETHRMIITVEHSSYSHLSSELSLVQPPFMPPDSLRTTLLLNSRAIHARKKMLLRLQLMQCAQSQVFIRECLRGSIQSLQ